MAISSRTGKATQRDVAEHLGVGQKTVSRAFGAPGYISKAMRARVMTAARELGYRPNVSARSMRTGRFDSIVLLQGAAQVLGNLSIQMLDGIQDELAAHNMDLTLARLTDEHLAGDAPLPKMLRERTADGILVKYDTNIPPRLYALLEETDLPVVWLNTKHDANSVYFEDHQAGSLLTKHLLDLGHARTAYVDFHVRHTPHLHYSRTDRLKGYEFAMRRRNQKPILFTPERHLVGDELWRETEAWLRAHEDVSAIITYSPDEGAHMLRSLEVHLGKRVPGDVSLAVIATAPPDLPIPMTMAINSEYKMGRIGTAMLLQKIEAPETIIPGKVMPFTLETGISTRMF